MTGIDYGAESDFHAPVMRVDDEGHGFLGVVYEATTRQKHDFQTGRPMWFRDRRPVADDQRRDGDQPVPEYVFHIAVKKGRGAFSTRDDNGDSIKDADGNVVLEVRDIAEQDIAWVAGAAWAAKAVKSVKLNTGHEVKLKRTAPARDSRGDRTKHVTCDIEVVGTVTDPKPYKQPEPVGASYDDTPEDIF